MPENDYGVLGSISSVTRHLDDDIGLFAGDFALVDGHVCKEMVIMGVVAAAVSSHHIACEIGHVDVNHHQTNAVGQMKIKGDDPMFVISAAKGSTFGGHFAGRIAAISCMSSSHSQCRQSVSSIKVI